MSDHTPRAGKSTENFGRPASTYSDFYIWTLSQPGLADTQYNVLTFCETCKYSYFSFFALLHTCRAVIQLLSRPGIQSYRSTSFRTNNLQIHYLNLTSNFCRIVRASFPIRRTAIFVNHVNLVKLLSTCIVAFLYKAEGMSRYSINT